MRHRLSVAVVVAAVAIVVKPADVRAQVSYGSETPVPVPSERTGWTLGLGVAAVPDYEGSDDYEAVPVPYLNWQGEHRYFNLTGLTAKANLLGVDFIEFGPRLHIRRKRDDVHNNQVDDMRSTDTAVEVGAFVAAKYQRWRAEAWVSQDVANAYNGQLAGAQGSYTYPISASWVLKGAVNTTYASGRFMETYFGVDSEDSQRSGLREYNANAGFKDVGGDVALSYTGWERWGLTGVFSYDRLLNDAEDSPVTKVGDENQYVAGLFFAYSWQGGK